MAEEGEAPKIIIASEHASMETIKQVAQQTKVEPTFGVKEQGPTEEEGKREEKEPEKEAEKEGRREGFLRGALGAFTVDEILETAETIARAKGAVDKFGGKRGEEGEKEHKEERAEKIHERGFEEVQEELGGFINKPNSQREMELRLERARLVNEAKEIGAFESLRGRFLEIQNPENNNFEKARKIIEDINIRTLETEAHGLEGWSDNFTGMLDEYRDVALLNMDLSMLKAKGQGGSDEAKRLIREIELRGWGSPPQGLEGLARKYLEEKEKKAVPEIAPQAGPMNLERFFPTPEKQRQEFLDLEEKGNLAVEVPTLTSLFYEGLAPVEKNFWHARMTLHNSRVLKQAAISADKLFPNPDIMSLTTGQLEALTNSRPEVAATIALYTVLVADPEKANNLFSEMSKDINFQPGFKHRLLTIDNDRDLTKFRQRFRAHLKEKFELSDTGARDAEQVAYNFIYMTGISEYVDSYYFQPEGPVDKDKEHPYQIKKDVVRRAQYRSLANPAMRNLMHLRERIIEDARGGKVWPPNVLGEWARAHTDTKGNIVQIPVPTTLIKSALHETKIRDGKEEGPLYPVVIEKGRGILSGSLRKEDALIPWEKSVSGQPFTNYYLNLNHALNIFTTVETSELPRDKTWSALRNSFLNLERAGNPISTEQKKTLVYLAYNNRIGWIDPRRAVFEPRKNLVYMQAFWSQFNKDNPSYFK